MRDLGWLGGARRRRGRTVAAGLILASLASVQAAASPAGATPASKASWRVIRTIGPDNTDLYVIAALRNHPSWLGGGAISSAGDFYAVVYRLTSGPLHQTALSTQLGSEVNSLSATSRTNVWASVEDVPGGQVDQLTSHGWHPYSFAIGNHDILMGPVVTTGPKNTWVFTEDFNTKIAYGYRFDPSGIATSCLWPPVRIP